MKNASLKSFSFCRWAALVACLMLSPAVGAQRIEAIYNSQPYQYGVVRKNTPILVLPYGESESEERANEYWARQVGQELRLNGFSSVHTLSWGGTEPLTVPEVVVFVEAESDLNSGEYESPDYEAVNSGIATSNCSGSGSNISCNHTPSHELRRVGSSTKRFTYKLHALTLYWHDATLPDGTERLAVGDIIALIMGQTFHEKCSSNTLLKFLVKETIARLDLEQPDEFNYRARLPRGESCRR